MKKGFIRKVGASFATLLSLVSCLNSVNAQFPDIEKKNLLQCDQNKTGTLVYSLTQFLDCCKVEGNTLKEKLKNLVNGDASFAYYGVGIQGMPNTPKRRNVFLKYQEYTDADDPLAKEAGRQLSVPKLVTSKVQEKDLKIQITLTPKEYVQIEDLLKFGQNGLMNSKDQNIRNFMDEVNKIKNPKPVEEKNEKIQLVNEEKNEKIQPEIEGKSENSFNEKWLFLLAVPPALYGMKKGIEKITTKKLYRIYVDDETAEEEDPMTAGEKILWMGEEPHVDERGRFYYLSENPEG